MRNIFRCIWVALVLAPWVLIGVAAHAAESAEPEILQAVPDWLQIVSIVVAAASSIAAILPTPRAQGVLLALRKILDVFALNVGKAKNASADKATERRP